MSDASISTKVAIVFPAHNRRDITLLCLKSLAGVESERLEIAIFVVDDGSTDGTAEAIGQKFPGVTVIRGSGDLFFTEGTNVGVREALLWNPDFVLMLNDDAVFDSLFLQYMVETAKAHDRSIVGPLLLLWDTPHKLFQVSPQWDTFYGGWRHWNQQTVWTVPDEPWEVDLIVGNCLLVPTAAIREHGLMNSKRYPNFGDAEYTPRLRKKGWKLLIEPRARVFCQPNTVPVRIRSLRFRELMDSLFINLHHSHNLRRRFFAYVEGGPSFSKGAAAFFVFLFRLLLGRNVESSFANSMREPPLSESFKDAVVGKQRRF